MQLFLTSSDTEPDQLWKVYAKALSEAAELYIASAYLTDWTVNQPVARKCKEIVFIVGTDFGLTRKAAMRNVLRWMPKHGSCSFLAAPRTPGGGFHPKIVAWRSRNGRYYTLTGSSNLSRAAFGGNYEANVLSPITVRQFRAVQKWLEPLIARCIPVTEDWINNHYKEAPIRPGGRGGHSLPPPVKLALPEGPTYEEEVRIRHKQQAAFNKDKKHLTKAVRYCARGRIRPSEFWRGFWDLWSGSQWRFQGSGLQLSCELAAGVFSTGDHSRCREGAGLQACS